MYTAEPIPDRPGYYTSRFLIWNQPPPNEALYIPTIITYTVTPEEQFEVQRVFDPERGVALGRIVATLEGKLADETE